MPTYTFADSAGEQYDIFLHMREAPPFGKWVDIAGKKLKRLVEMPQKPIVQSIRFKAYSQVPWAEGAEAYDSEGTPCFSSKKAVQKYLDTQNSKVEKTGINDQGVETIGYGGKDAL